MLGRSKQEVLRKRVYSFIFGIDFNQNGVLQWSTMQFLYFTCHRSWEQVRVSLLRNLGQNQINLLFKVHWQKSISFVENQEAKPLQVKPFRIGQMIGHASRGTNDHVRFLRQSDGLTDHVETTYEHGTSKADKRADCFKLLSDLHAEFSRRRHNASEERLWGFKKCLYHWDCEGSRLSRTRLSQTNDIPSF